VQQVKIGKNTLPTNNIILHSGFDHIMFCVGFCLAILVCLLIVIFAEPDFDFAGASSPPPSELTASNSDLLYANEQGGYLRKDNSVQILRDMRLDQQERLTAEIHRVRTIYISLGDRIWELEIRIYDFNWQLRNPTSSGSIRDPAVLAERLRQDNAEMSLLLEQQQATAIRLNNLVALRSAR